MTGMKVVLALCAMSQTASAFVVHKASSSTPLFSLKPLPGDVTPTSESGVESRFTKRVWETVTPALVQGSSLKTFSVDEHSPRVQVLLRTEGRPLNAKVELWHGPDYTPFTMQVYLEDGSLSPFNAVVDAPYQNTVALFNTGNLEYPLSGAVLPDRDGSLGDIKEQLRESVRPLVVQGGALRTWNFDPSVASVQVLLQTDGRHLVARLELLHGPNNIKQNIEVYSSDGKKRSFFAIFETPEAGCVLRIVNKYTVEYPLEAIVEPYLIDLVD